MVCFRIILAYPKNPRPLVNMMMETRLKHLNRHMVGDLREKIEEKNIIYQSLFICDEEAVAFIRDLPAPIHVLTIHLLHGEQLLYSNTKYLKTTPPPPQDTLLKQLYWQAKSCEPRFSPPPS